MTPTMRWLLEHPLLKGGQALTGSGGMDKALSGVGSMENMEDERWLREGDFVLTSGSFFQENAQHAGVILKGLLSHGCAGLGVRIDRYFDFLPAPFLEAAREAGFPVVSVPYGCSVSDLSGIVYRAICAGEQDEDQRLAASYRALTESVLESHDLSRLVGSVAQAVGMPAFLTGEDFQIIEAASPDGREPPVRAPLPLFSETDVRFLKTRYREQPYESISHTVLDGGERQNYIIFPVEDRRQPAGYLCLLEGDSELTHSNHRFVLSALSVAAMELTFYKLKQKKPKVKMSSFVENVLLNPTATQSENDIQCHLYGFDTDTPHLCFVIQPDDFESCTIHQRKRTEAMIWEAMDKALEGNGIKEFRLSYYRSLILFLFKEDFAVQSAALCKGKEIASAALRALEATDVRCHMGISKAYAGSGTIKRCFDQCLQALELGNRLHPEWSVYSYHDDDVYHFLLDHLSPEQLTKFYSETIKPLVEYEKKYNSDLLPTLHLYYECGQSLSRTAKQLYIHRNTMLYRMDKIEKILDVDLRKTNESFRTQLGLYIMHLIQHLN